MQQELGNVTRQLAALQEKKDADGPLSDADKAKMAKAEQRLTAIRQFVDDPIAQEVLDLTEKVGEQDSLKKELKETRRQERRGILTSMRSGKARRTRPRRLGDDGTTRARSPGWRPSGSRNDATPRRSGRARKIRRLRSRRTRRHRRTRSVPAQRRSAGR
jgi:hypothetical protein